MPVEPQPRDISREPLPQVVAQAAHPPGLGVELGARQVAGRSQGHDPGHVLGARLEAPLLAGSAPRIVKEPLTQAERDVVYAARSFESFRRDFSLDVASLLYAVLQQRDRIKNEEANYQRLSDLSRRNEALAEAGRMTDVQVDQARQQELSSKNALVLQQQRYTDLLDDFKLFLGLPIETDLSLDQSELDRLVEMGIQEIELDSAALERLALEQRLDYQTTRDRLEDAGRRVRVTADRLRADLDVTVGANASTIEGRPFGIRSEELLWSLGVSYDLPIQRVAERNAYRSALIAQRAAQRAVDESGDSIRVRVRDDQRQLRSTLETYSIQTVGVELAERRVESANLNLEAGRASTRDLLETQDDLVAAQNAVTSALIDFYLARLDLYRDLELLRVTEEGIVVPDTIPLPRGEALAP